MEKKQKKTTPESKLADVKAEFCFGNDSFLNNEKQAVYTKKETRKELKTGKKNNKWKT
jgi:hypothetical protein